MAWVAMDHTTDNPSPLPITAIFPRLRSALDRHRAAVLVAPPGAGKTTAVPLDLLMAPWLAGQRILLLEPRRLAARAAASHMAARCGESVGQTVGYRVRMESRVGRQTRVEVVTEGVLTRMIQTDASLSGVGLVIFDEFHERSLDADLGLALCRDIQGVLNAELRILVMSATLDPAPVADLLGGAPLIRCEGRAFPVETRHAAAPAGKDRERWTAEVIRRAVAEDAGSILVFLPGVAEIRRVARHLAETALPDVWTVAPLYGSLSREQQNAAIRPARDGRRKIVLSSAIAETSLTIEGIGVVVDSGLQRAPRFDPVSGMTRLVTLPASQASADQRRGRAGRLGPGICYRLWSAAMHPTLPPHNRPEILDADLTNLAIELALWGISDPEPLHWLDPPPPPAFAKARALLTDLGALDDSGAITSHGRRMAALPLHPRLAHMVLMACMESMGDMACTLAAILSERDPLSFDHRQRDADLSRRLLAVMDFRRRRQPDLTGCRVDQSALRRIATLAAMLRKRLGIATQSQRPSQTGRLLAWAYPDRIAQLRTGMPGRFLLANGRGAVVDASQPLAASEYIVVAHLDGDRREARIFMAAATDRACLADQFAHRIGWRESVAWDPQRQAVTARRMETLGALTLASGPLRDPDPDAVLTAMLAGIRAVGIDALPWTRSLRSWQSRVMLLAQIDAAGGPWPDVSDAALTDTVAHWLSPYLAGVNRLAALTPAAFTTALHGLLDYRQRQLLESLAPTHIVVPSGSRLPVDYHAPTPVLAVRIQEMFGAVETPRIAGGRLALCLHLLSPAGRPAQITSDLAGFWKNSYPAVKRELKGRYPKHVWPDDPLNALPTARAKRRPTN